MILGEKKNTNIIHIYHHGDMDGIMAGACIYHMVNLYGYDKKLYRINNYAQTLDFSDVKEDDILFFVDYSFTNQDNVDNLRKLMDKLWKFDGYKCANHVYWIDHHKTSLELKDTFPLGEASSIINTGLCGAALCWLFGSNSSSITKPEQLYISVNSTEFMLKYRKDKLKSIIPKFIQYVNSWDIWLHDMPNDGDFNLGFMTEFQDPSNNRLDLIINEDDDKLGSKTLEELIDFGKAITKYLEVTNTQRLQEMGYEFILDGYKCIMYNGRGNSLTFGNLIDDYDICAMFYFQGDTYIYSLYSKEVDTSEISKKLGGGGHPGASGFQSKELLFKKGTVFNTEEYLK